MPNLTPTRTAIVSCSFPSPASLVASEVASLKRTRSPKASTGRQSPRPLRLLKLRLRQARRQADTKLNLLDLILSVRRCVEASLRKPGKAIKPDWTRVDNCADFEDLRRQGCARRRRKRKYRSGVFKIPDPERAGILVRKLERQLFLMSGKR